MNEAKRIIAELVEKYDQLKALATGGHLNIDFSFEMQKTDKEIDRQVYDLYGLTEKEIKSIEGEK